jgi:N-hydroxyarylamine O-acetyltransferase
MQTAPVSPFTGDPVVTIATADGHRKLSGTTLTETTGADEHDRTVPQGDWHATLDREFALRYHRP